MNMSSFGSLFPFRTNMHSAITTMLEEPDVTLERLLDEDASFLSDFKTQNPKLMQFMTYDKYKTLLEFVTKVGPEGDQKRSYKFPFVACDVLTTESNSPAEFILPEKDLFIEEDTLEQVEVEVDDPAEESPEDKKEEPIVTEDMPTLEQPEGDQPQNPPTVSEEAVIEKEEPEETNKPDKPKNKILVKKQVVKKVKKQVPALISDLFSYLDGEMNYTLAGYFSRILTTLFSKKSNLVVDRFMQLTAYFFSDPKNTRILDHVESRSIAEVVIKFLTIDSLSFLPERQQLIEEILGRVSKNSNPGSMGNLSLVLCEVIEKYSSTVKSLQGAKEMLEFVYGQKFCRLLLGCTLSDDEQVSIHSAPVLLCSLVSIRNLIDSKEQSKSSDLVDKYQQLMTFLKGSLADSSDLGSLFRDFFKKATAKLHLTKSMSPTLGMGRIKLVESLFFLVKFDFYSIQTTVPESQFFQQLLHLTKEYELNNVLHNEVVKIITFVLELEQPNPLVNSLFEEAGLLDFLYQQVLEDEALQTKIAQKERGVCRKGYIGHIVKIGQLLLKLSGSEQIFTYLADERWTKVKELVEKETFEAEKNLAGYTTKKDDANMVMFQKEDILALHQAFLSQPPVTTYPEPEPELAQDPMEETIAMIEKKLNLYVPAEEPAQAKEDPVDVAEQSADPLSITNYWKDKKVLNYEINDLLLQLQ